MSRVRNYYKYKSSNPPDDIWTHKGLSLQAKGLFTYMWTKPDNWIFYQDFIAKELEISVDMVRKYIQELLKSGWLSREQARTERGKFNSFDYVLHISPCRDLTDTDNNQVGSNSTYIHKTNTIKEKNKFSENKDYELNYNPNFLT